MRVWMEESFESEFGLGPEDYFCQPLPGGPRLIILNREIIAVNPLLQFYAGQKFTDVGIFGHEDCHYYADMKGEWQGVREAERTHHVGDLNEAGAILKQHWPWVQRLHLRYATVTPDKRKLAAVEKIL